jgi:carbon storage regulator
MLILTRRAGEVIRVGCDVKITVLAITGNQVKIGFDAPRSIPVDRAEVAERKRNIPPPISPSARSHHPAAVSSDTLDP